MCGAPAHEAPQVKELDSAEAIKYAEAVVRRVEADSAGINDLDEVLHAVGAKPSGSDEDVIDVAHDSKPLAARTFKPKLPGVRLPPEFFE